MQRKYLCNLCHCQ